MKIYIRLLCAVFAVVFTLSLCSCGSKKAKMREGASSAQTALDEARNNTQGEGNEDDVFADETVKQTESYTGDIAVVERHKYEFYDYNSALSNYNKMTYNVLTSYQYTYAVKYYKEFKAVKDSLVSSIGSDSAEFYCKLQADGSAKYVDENGKAVSNQTVLNFMKNHPIISAVRYDGTGGTKVFYADFYEPTFVGDLDYSLKMSVIFNALENEETLLSNSNIIQARKIESGWHYIIEQNDKVKIRIVD